MTGSTLRDLIARAASGPPDALARELGPIVLLGPPPEDATRPSAFQYDTEHSKRSVPSPIEQLLDAVVFPVRKGEGGRLADTILIGRASSNDVVIEHTSVSKLHAKITVEPSGGLRVADASSTNGTFVDGRQLGGGESAALRPGSELRIGDVPLRVHDTKNLLQIASRFRAM